MSDEKLPYLNIELSVEKRADDLVSRMTLAEKISQMIFNAPAIERLNIPAHNWWNECLHGVGRAGVATVFPQPIGMAATFNTELIQSAADAISDEARAKHHEFVRKGDRGIYKGLTFWSPNVNIFRDPRWGRGHETYGEDPYLTGKMGVTFIKGLQGNHPKYRKVDATAKHFAVHSGPEHGRHGFNAQVSEKDLRETYLPAFKECVIEGHAAAVMGAYNRVNGEPCCASKTLLQNILRKEWGFTGYVVSDCGAICDIFEHHKAAESKMGAAAMAVNNGCELNCGDAYSKLLAAVASGLITEETVDEAVKKLFTSRFRLGMFDPEEFVPYANIPYEVNDCEEHRLLAAKVARESIVLLKNHERLLPLKKELKSLAVIGPNADNYDILIGNYNGIPSRYVTLIEGIRNAVSKDTKVIYAKGCELTGKSVHGFSEAISAAERAEVVIMCLGLSPRLEGEEGDAYNSDASGDRIHIDLPGMQQKLLENIYAVGKPVILVLAGGSPLAVNWATENIPAIVEVWYPGEEGGNALADVLFGNYNPAGRLPVTFIRSLDDIPPFEDYSMRGRTYRYLEKEPLYPFGFGLSYTSFEYSNLVIAKKEINVSENVHVSVDVTNTGDCSGEEVVQLYISYPSSLVVTPRYQLQGVQRITLKPGETKNVRFTLTAKQMSIIDNDGRCIIEPGEFKIFVGGCQPDSRSSMLASSTPKTDSFNVKGVAMDM